MWKKDTMLLDTAESWLVLLQVGLIELNSWNEEIALDGFRSIHEWEETKYIRFPNVIASHHDIVMYCNVMYFQVARSPRKVNILCQVTIVLKTNAYMMRCFQILKEIIHLGRT